MKKFRYKYPDRPGWKEIEVSKANAKANARRFTRMQQVVLTLYEGGFVGTADDAATRLGVTPFSIRPRCTELVKKGELVKLRIDRSLPGRHAWVLALADKGKLPNLDLPSLFEDDPSNLPDDSGVLQPREAWGGPEDDGQPSEQQEWHDFDKDC
jgi:hypothetical protein